MGLFLAVSALRTDAVETVADALNDLAPRPSSPDQDDPALLFPSEPGWTVVYWEPHFDGVAKATRNLAARLDVLASVLSVYDDDYWVHALMRGAEVLDRFCTEPDELTDDPRERETWQGNPDVIAAAVGIEAASIAPYLPGGVPDDQRDQKAFPDDEFELWDAWVIADFWRRLGITYPEDFGSPQATVHLPRPVRTDAGHYLNWTEHLPLADPWSTAPT